MRVFVIFVVTLDAFVGRSNSGTSRSVEYMYIFVVITIGYCDHNWV